MGNVDKKSREPEADAQRDDGGGLSGVEAQALVLDQLRALLRELRSRGPGAAPNA
jgi:hypothetical protein